MSTKDASTEYATATRGQTPATMDRACRPEPVVLPTRVLQDRCLCLLRSRNPHPRRCLCLLRLEDRHRRRCQTSGEKSSWSFRTCVSGRLANPRPYLHWRRHRRSSRGVRLMSSRGWSWYTSRSQPTSTGTYRRRPARTLARPQGGFASCQFAVATDR